MMNCVCQNWEEIRGFNSPGEYSRFVRYIDDQVKRKVTLEIKVDENYQKGMVYGGRWFQCPDCKIVWRLVEPDFPFKGLWEPVKVKWKLAKWTGL